jgi:hypothetical protein
MTGLGMVRMISHVGVRLTLRHRGGGQPTARWQDKSRRLRLGRSVEERGADQGLGDDVSSLPQPAYSQNPLRFSTRRSPHGERP